MKRWVKWLVLGILSVVFGAFCLANALAASVAVTALTGALLIIIGAFQIAAGLGDQGYGAKAVSFVLGALLVILGVSLLRNPLEGIMSLSLIVMLLLGAAGALRIGLSFQMRGTQYYWPMLISGVLSLGLALYILLNFQTAAPILLGTLLGIELLLNGAGLIALAFFLRRRTA